MPQVNQADISNRILRSLPSAEWRELQPHLIPQAWPMSLVIQEDNIPVAYAAFPESGLLSTVLLSDHNVEVEIGLTGCEGQAGAAAILADTPSLARVLIQSDGHGFLLPTPVFRDLWARGGAFQHLLLQYNDAFAAQTAYSAMCNRLHTVEERLSRWLLMIQDTLGTDRLILADTFIASMLGIRLSGVPVALGVMQQAGIVRRTHKEIIILNRPQLEASACECYAVLHRRYDLWEQKAAAIKAHAESHNA